MSSVDENVPAGLQGENAKKRTIFLNLPRSLFLTARKSKYNWIWNTQILAFWVRSVHTKCEMELNTLLQVLWTETLFYIAIGGLLSVEDTL